MVSPLFVKSAAAIVSEPVVRQTLNFDSLSYPFLLVHHPAWSCRSTGCTTFPAHFSQHEPRFSLDSLGFTPPAAAARDIDAPV